MSATSVDVAARGSCPQCGAGLPLGRGGGTVTCAFCHLTSTYTVVPAPAASSRRDELQAIAIIPLHASRGALVAGWSATTLEAYDPGGGQPGWTVTLPRTSQPIVTSFERLYVPTDTDELIAIDAATGRIAFVAALPGPTSQVDGFPCVADVCGPSQAHACVLVHAGGQLVALDRMSGAEVARWAVEPPRCWATAIGYVLVGPVAGEVWLVDPMRAVPLARVPVATDKGLGGVIASGHAFVTGGTDDHTAIQLADGALAWRAAAPWDPATGTGAAFARELFVANGTTITALACSSSRSIEATSAGCAASCRRRARRDGTSSCPKPAPWSGMPSSETS
ncbi:MAG: PQQ-binding-like beta-propeller repeat protein [Proteobacteria bacterium]|nr:PQQ-binding-like beta-propeller repeat protein [Pseudomonadota bacterium]